uniref:Uncharacterized protein n=1 Tax=Marseillevirus LCMAC202 TaxID=2506606 RepID=A0A481YZG0_9VIRU|nr:MAG: hypothetical protein LCMAC202_02650 [Marseillevirus LCMAC202]
METIIGQVKSATGHPKLNMGILGASSGLMFISAISGFISYSKLSGLKDTKNLLLGASLLSLLSTLMLGFGIFLIYRHNKKMDAAFKGFFSFALLVLSGLFMFISGIMYAIAAVQIATRTDPSGNKYKDTYRTSYTTAVISAFMTLGGLGAVGISFLTALVVMRKKPRHIGPPPVTTQVRQRAPPQYSAESILSQLQTATGISAATERPQETGST